MEIAVGIQTCERPDFLKKCIKTLVKHNPIVTNWNFFIIDDASKDPDVADYLCSLKFTNWIFHNSNRIGISDTLRVMVENICERKELELLLCIQADWYCSREIDFNAISTFFEGHPKIGQLRTIRNKGGEDAPITRHAGLKNAITKSKVVSGGKIRYGNEYFTYGTWCYSDLPNFMRREALECLFKDFDSSKRQEYYRMLNMHEGGWKISMLDDQPFWNQDPKATMRTPGGKR